MGLHMMGTGGYGFRDDGDGRDGFGSDGDGRDGFQCLYPCRPLMQTDPALTTTLYRTENK